MGGACGLIDARGAQTEGRGTGWRGARHRIWCGEMDRGRSSGDRHGGDERSHFRSEKSPLEILSSGALIGVWLHSKDKGVSRAHGDRGMGVCGMPYRTGSK